MLGIAVGFLPVGHVDEVDGEAIRTTFILFGLPLLPFGSTYRGFDIGYRAKSILLGYVRWYLPIVAAVMAYGQYRPLASFADYLWPWPALLMAVWGLSFLVGRASRRERERRQLLNQATRMTGYPSWLSDSCARSTYEHLRRRCQMEQPLHMWFALAVYHRHFFPDSRAARKLEEQTFAALTGRSGFTGEELERATRAVEREVEEGPLPTHRHGGPRRDLLSQLSI